MIFLLSKRHWSLVFPAHTTPTMMYRRNGAGQPCRTGFVLCHVQGARRPKLWYRSHPLLHSEQRTNGYKRHCSRPCVNHLQIPVAVLEYPNSKLCFPQRRRSGGPWMDMRRAAQYTPRSNLRSRQNNWTICDECSITGRMIVQRVKVRFASHPLVALRGYKTLCRLTQGQALPENAVRQDGGRGRAAPHIKTYIRYNGASIDWALLTSANLSKQAWGEASRKPSGDVRIASWEIGVLIWPNLIEKDSIMVPALRKDTPTLATPETRQRQATRIVGVRVPYSLPLQQYAIGEVPWVATMTHRQPDQFGRIWDMEG